jgi:cyclic dehypoxanthinyl futalosine synthase
MDLKETYKKIFSLDFITFDEALELYNNVSVSELMFVASELRKIHKKDSQKVGWIIDRNVNITNVCYAQCKFCNFCRKINDTDSYVTSLEEYKIKIEEMYNLGGRQLLLQGGMHPNLGIDFYIELFKDLKKHFPDLKLHALSPTEIVHISKKENITYKETLKKLIDAGLDSLPGAGAEILSDRVRKIVSPAKCTSEQWLEVMSEAHKLNMPTSATMMYGFIETMEERLQHIFKIRDLQAQKPKENYGFITFIPWPYQPEKTRLTEMYPELKKINDVEYLKIIAISRIILNNISNIQTSWLTVGKDIAQLTLWGGANDMGSIMIEENVVSAAGANNKMSKNSIQSSINEAGFVPVQRNQKYEFIE